MPQLHDVAVSLDDLVGITGTQRDQPWDCAQGRELLDGLVSRTVFTVTHGVMGKNENGRQFHQGGEADGRPRVITEDKEGRAERPQFRQRQPVDDRAHGVFTDTEVQVLPTRAIGLEVAGVFVGQRCFVRRPKVPRAAEEPGNVLCKDVQYFARGIPSGEAFRVGGEYRKIAVPPDRQFAPLHQIDFVGEFGRLLPVLGKNAVPSASKLRTSCTYSSGEASVHSIRYKKLRVLRPPVGALAESNLVITQRLAVGC